MQVILLSDVPKIGHKYDLAEVKSGYAQNFLIPQKLAELATKKKIDRLKELKIQRAEEEKIQSDLLSKNLEALSSVSIEVREKVNEQGHLFKGIHKEEIQKALSEQAHVQLPLEAIKLSDPIKEAGEHDIIVKVGEETGTFKLTITPEK